MCLLSVTDVLTRGEEKKTAVVLQAGGIRFLTHTDLRLAFV